MTGPMALLWGWDTSEAGLVFSGKRAENKREEVIKGGAVLGGVLHLGAPRSPSQSGSEGSCCKLSTSSSSSRYKALCLLSPSGHTRQWQQGTLLPCQFTLTALLETVS